MCPSSKSEWPPPSSGAAATFVTAAPTASKNKRGVLLVLTGHDRGRVIPLENGKTITFGRAESCEERFPAGDLSRHHARMACFGGNYLVEDLKSTNGTFLNDRRITSAEGLREGDRVRLGSSIVLNFSLVTPEEEQSLSQLYRGRQTVGNLDVAEGRSIPINLDDLREASEFQKKALPPPPQLEGVDVDVFYRPLDGVGGDLYHFTQLDTRQLRVLVADATGHGIKASLTTMLILSEYEIIRRSVQSPAQILSELNDRLATTYGHVGVRLTALCADFDFAAGVLRYASAAHPQPLLVRRGQGRELEGGGSFVGLMAGLSYPEHSVVLEAGDSLYLFTDGVSEQTSEGGDLYGERRLEQTLMAGAGSLEERAFGPLLAFAGGAARLEDDITIVSVRWRG